MSSPPMSKPAPEDRRRGLARWIKWRRFREAYRARMFASSAEGFVRLFNLRARLGYARARIAKIEGGFEVIGERKSVRFGHRRQGDLAFADGLEARGREMAKTYMLGSIDFAPGDLVIDCGANTGDLKLHFENLGIEVEYVGVEPSPVEHRFLAHNVAPSVTYNLGLWKENGALSFYVKSDTADSSLIPIADYDERIEVETKRLDALFDRPVKLLKLEAEGAEPEVLEGATGLLPQIEWIAADLGPERGDARECTFAPVVNFLLRREFELVDLRQGRLCALFRNRRRSA